MSSRPALATTRIQQIKTQHFTKPTDLTKLDSSQVSSWKQSVSHDTESVTQDTGSTFLASLSKRIWFSGWLRCDWAEDEAAEAAAFSTPLFEAFLAQNRPQL